MAGAVGEAIWAGGYLGVGWVFGDNWEAVVEVARGLSGMALPLAAATALGVVGWLLLRARRGGGGG